MEDPQNCHNYYDPDEKTDEEVYKKQEKPPASNTVDPREKDELFMRSLATVYNCKIQDIRIELIEGFKCYKVGNRVVFRTLA